MEELGSSRPWGKAADVGSVPKVRVLKWEDETPPVEQENVRLWIINQGGYMRTHCIFMQIKASSHYIFGCERVIVG
jgi:hypothetical protein